jgi:hypothetical protein
MPACHAGGRGFESLRSRQNILNFSATAHIALVTYGEICARHDMNGSEKIKDVLASLQRDLVVRWDLNFTALIWLGPYFFLLMNFDLLVAKLLGQKQLQKD